MDKSLAVFGMLATAALVCGLLANVPRGIDMRRAAGRAGVTYAILAFVWAVFTAVRP